MCTHRCGVNSDGQNGEQGYSVFGEHIEIQKDSTKLRPVGYSATSRTGRNANERVSRGVK